VSKSQRDLDASWNERFEVLTAVLGEVIAVQHELLNRLGDLQEDVLALYPVDREALTQDAEGARAEAQQSQRQARRLVQRASELQAEADRLRSEAENITS